MAGDAFLLKLSPPSQNYADAFLAFLYGAPYEWNKLDELVRRLTKFTCLSLELKRCYFYVILIINMISLFMAYNNMVILTTFTFMSHYIDLICIITYCVSF